MLDFSKIEGVMPVIATSLEKSPGRFFCPECKKTMSESQFFKTTKSTRFPTGLLPHCKSCVTMKVVDTDERTFLGILKDLDLPYIPAEWRKLLAKKEPGMPSIFGKYVSKMRLGQFNKYKWADTERLVKEEIEAITSTLALESETYSEAEERAEEVMSLEQFVGKLVAEQAPQVTQPMLSVGANLTPETSTYGLTEKDIADLRRKWGPDYNEEEFASLEQMYNDFRDSYIIQDPIAISHAKMIAKMTLKVNKYLDIDDVDSASKLGRQLDQYIKSANLAPVQQKDRQQATFAISQLAFLIERHGGFIPDFAEIYDNDPIDKMILDMKEYTAALVAGEEGLGEMVANAKDILAEEALPSELSPDDEFLALQHEILGEIDAISNTGE